MKVQDQHRHLTDAEVPVVEQAFCTAAAAASEVAERQQLGSMVCRLRMHLGQVRSGGHPQSCGC